MEQSKWEIARMLIEVLLSEFVPSAWMKKLEEE